MDKLSKDKIGITIVSAEKELFSGDADMVFVTGREGELGIAPKHSPLLTGLKPGEVRVQNDGQEEVFYISGGMLEIQPYVVTVLADTALRAHDIDEAAVLEAKERAEKALAEASADLDYYRVTTELAQAVAQIRAVRRLRKQFG